MKMTVLTLGESKGLYQTSLLQSLCGRLSFRSWGHEAFILAGEIKSHGDKYWEKARKPNNILVRDERAGVGDTLYKVMEG